MRAIDILKEVASLASYTVDGTDSQSTTNKARALRRVNLIRSYIVSKVSGKWQSQYREGWLPIVPVYSTGTVALTQGSRTVTGSGTTWTAAMVGRQFLGPDNAYYLIIARNSDTEIVLSEPYQGASVTSGGSYQIWKSDYRLYPEALSVIDFLNYGDSLQMQETFPKKARFDNPRATTNETPRSFVVLGREDASDYSTGTITGTINTNTLTGTLTSWLGNVEPGWTINIGSYYYTVRKVNSDTSITLYQKLVAAASGASYSASARNCLTIRFLKPASQQIVNYAYFAKAAPLVNDSDEDWISEMWPELIAMGTTKYDFIDKNDPIRARESALMFDNAIRDAHVADSGQFGGTIVVGLDIPDHARE